MTLIPEPLPLNHRALRNSRFQVSVCGPQNERGAYPHLATGRFTSLDDAKAWADGLYPTAHLVHIEHLSARTGWQSSAVVTRRNGEWV